jgi:hypothetical protein
MIMASPGGRLVPLRFGTAFTESTALRSSKRGGPLHMARPVISSRLALAISYASDRLYR